MARPNKELQAAIDKFADASGATAAQVAQLREAIDDDSEVMQSLNAAAKAGQVKEFALLPGTEYGVGEYDKDSGIVSLPASVFQQASAKPGADLVGAVKIQEMSVRFAHAQYKDEAGNSLVVSQEMIGNLQRTINEAPVLVAQIKSAAANGHLEQFKVLEPGRGAGGTYNGYDKAINLPAPNLQNKTSSNPTGKFSAGSLTFVLGHETQHGFNFEEKQAAYKTFDSQIRAIARDKNPINDYTQPIGALIQAGREDEAQAEIAGWNAVASRIRYANPAADLVTMSNAQINQVRDFVDYNAVTMTATPKSGLTFNGDYSLSNTAVNVAAMGKHYFDKFPDGTPGVAPQKMSSLGPYREADYPNYYGGEAIERAITIDRKNARSVEGVDPKMHINMGQLRLNERLIERLGLEIDPNPERPQAYYDTSQSPPALHHFEHTRTGPNRNQHVPIDPEILSDAAVQATERLTPSQPGHADHPLYAQIADQVREQDRQHGRQWDETSERMTASLLVLAKDSGLSRVDHVVFSDKNGQVAAGENVFVVQGRLDDPAHVRAHMKTDEAARTPEAVSFDKVEVLNERIAQHAAQVQSLGQTPDDTPKGPGMGGR
jgi:hypothetical protein